ncbi:cytochrome c biogenesis protein DipZ [Pseudomonas sp. JL2]|uniref:cytochrome c biogenesis protein DipZ n=1 Tax=Pseudomonas sp. JL2 TaxID=2919942 RepID=UPI00285F8C2E|nr:cytochrome c biogenesis protein DipZ [Pseudomonas sp. JL2]MDR8386273.1 cytochrome c biogenesis protein DipZ [Pseudomonas sp. JL2]
MLLIAFLGGILTILSPCILPVVPFLFARANRSRGSVLLTLAGMVLTFALVSSLAVVSSEWVVRASSVGRQIALWVMVLFALSLMFSRVGIWLARPLVSLGNRIDNGAGRMAGPVGSVLIGVATGLLWAPCAGPILGVILTGAMLQGASAETSLLLLAYGLGSALSLGVLILAGRGLADRLKLSLPITTWLRRGTGVVVLLAAVAIGTGADDRLLASTSSQGAATLEQGVLKNVPKAIDYLVEKASAASLESLQPQGEMPSLEGAVQWLNSPPLSSESLRGKVVLVDFWTYDCINCQRTLPYVNDWARKYEKEGLVVIGVHTPEYGYEKIIDNVREQVRKLGINYPVAIDNQYAIWRAFNNQYWPAHYFIDAKGQVRYSHFGEGRYAEQERVIGQLLEEAKASQ